MTLRKIEEGKGLSLEEAKAVVSRKDGTPL
jgi:hypothetical protein